MKYYRNLKTQSKFNSIFKNNLCTSRNDLLFIKHYYSGNKTTFFKKLKVWLPLFLTTNLIRCLPKL